MSSIARPASNALIVVDVQNDFCEGGALAVDGGNAVAEEIAKFVDNYQRDYNFVLFTKDWHNPPPDTNGGHFSDTPDFVDSWPVHCVAGSEGAQLHPALAKKHLPFSGDHVFYKGQGRPDYSGWQGKNVNGITLPAYMAHHNIKTVDIVGIAGDYCVLQTALDIKRNGIDVVMLTNMVASVGGTDATARAVRTLKEAN